MRPQVGKQKEYKNAIKIVHHFVRVYEKHGKVKATAKYVTTLNWQNALCCKTAAEWLILCQKSKRTLFALKRGDYFYARKAKHALYGVWYTTISIAKEIKSSRKNKNCMIS